MELRESISVLTAEDPLARFIFFEHHFAATTGRVKPQAFLPPPDGSTSVFATRNLPESDIWELGQMFVAVPSQRSLRARADAFVRDAVAASLEVILDNIPPRHANITGWPAEKSAQKLRAEELAARATLKLAPPAMLGGPPLVSP